MSVAVHEHFCYMCYGHKTNGVASGWWRCSNQKCVGPEKFCCLKHRKPVAASPPRTEGPDRVSRTPPREKR